MSLELTPELQKQVEQIARRSGKSTDEVLRDLIADGLAQRASQSPVESGESLYDALARSGSLGCEKGDPADLSTNPRHMEGFGEARG